MTSLGLRRGAALLLLCAMLALTGAVEAASADGDGIPATWPVSGARVVLEPFVVGEHRWSPGHRGIDVAAPTPDAEVRAPAAGVVAFAGRVVDRSLVTIDIGAGRVVTLEPVEPLVAAGARMRRGDVVGRLAAGGHTPAGALHVGLREDGAYRNPLVLWEDLPRAVLLPCC